MRAVDIIRRKRDGETLTSQEIQAFIQGAVASQGTPSHWPTYQISALLMAIVLRGMTATETADLTAAMVGSGHKLDWNDLPGPKIDKHSTGGVGDKTSLILAPLAAACGVRVPMMSGRGLGHTGGTLDKLEAIPGFRVGLALPEFRSVLAQVGCGLIGQTSDIAPADKVLYALRDVTATVESIPLISASIMSKKIAEGVDGLVLDVKCGRGAFMKTLPEARQLARSLVDIGRANAVRTEAVLTDMDAPLGHAIGNSVEIMETVRVLRGEGDRVLTDLSVHLAARMVRLGGLAPSLEASEVRVRAALASGQGLEKFRAIITAQGGDPRVVDDFTLMPTAPLRHQIRAPRSGYLAKVHADLLGHGAMLLGAGRARAEDEIDPAVGILLLADRGQEIRQGDGLAEIRYGDGEHLAAAIKQVQQAFVIEDQPPVLQPILLESLDES